MFLLKPLTTLRTIGAVLILCVIAGLMAGDAPPDKSAAVLRPKTP